MRLLKFFQDPTGWAKTAQCHPTILDGRQPGRHPRSGIPHELRGRRNFYSQVWQELWRGGLVNTDGLGTLMSGDGTKAKLTSEHGDEFLRFIEHPIDQQPQR